MSKHRSGATVDDRMRPWVALSAWLIASGPAVANGAPDGQRTARAITGSKRAASDPPHRYVSGQAYYHAILAELALGEGKTAVAADELQLARVYDHESVWLTLLLGRVMLAAGKPEKAERLIAEIKRLGPVGSEVSLLEAQVALAKGADGAAEQILKRLVERDPGLVEAVMLYAGILEAQKRVPEALKTLRRAADRAPQSVEPLLALARIEIRRQGWSAATLALERAAERDERRVEVIAELARIDHRLDRDSQAVERLRTLSETLPGDRQALFEAARAELWTDNDERAEAYLGRFERQSKRTEDTEQVATLYLEEGRFEKAAIAFEAVVSARPGDGALRLRAAQAHAARGAVDKALAHLEQILHEDPHYVEARVRLARLLALPDRAELSIQQALRQRPSEPRFLAAQIRARIGAGRAREAVELAKRARKIAPTSLDLFHAEGSALAAVGDLEEAIPLLAQGGEDAILELAELEAKRGRPEAAIEALRRAERRWPSARIVAELSRRLADRPESLGEAERLAKEALAADPGSPDALQARGVVALKRGDKAAAERFFQRARRLEPGQRGGRVAIH